MYQAEPAGNSLRVAVASHSAGGGGAFKAASRLHNALRSHGVESVFAVGDRHSPSEGVFRVGKSRREFQYVQTEVRYLKAYLEALIMKTDRSKNPLLRSPALIPGSAIRDLMKLDVEIMNLHWVCGGFLSIGQIGRLLERFKCVWTLHDQWPFLGSEHYGWEGSDARWSKDSNSSSLRLRGGVDIDWWTWKRKKNLWSHPARIITPSAWLANQAKESELMGDWPISVIPNAVDLDRYRPMDMEICRGILGLPKGPPLVLFAGMGGARSPAKGWHLFVEVISMLAKRVNDFQIIAVGETTTFPDETSGIKINRLGFLADELSMSLAYNAATVVVVPSVIDNLPQTATEAQSCGRPVVGFRVGGLPDAVSDTETGLLAEGFDLEGFSEYLRAIVESESLGKKLGANARVRAEKLWNPQVIAEQYIAVFSELY